MLFEAFRRTSNGNPYGFQLEGPGFSGRRRWENPNLKLSSLQAYQERSSWADDAFQIHRPLNQRIVRPKPSKLWRINEVGTKRRPWGHVRLRK